MIEVRVTHNGEKIKRIIEWFNSKEIELVVLNSFGKVTIRDLEFGMNAFPDTIFFDIFLLPDSNTAMLFKLTFGGL